MIAHGFEQSEVNMYVYYRGAVMLMLFVDDGIYCGPTNEAIDECYKLMSEEFVDKHGKVHRAFTMTDEGDLSDYLGVKIE